VNTIYLDRAEIEEKIKAGNTYEGHWVLAVDPDGSAHRIYWAQERRQWNPWPDGWLTIDIPALDPDGSGRESEDAQDMLRAVLGPEGYEEAKRLSEEEDLGWPEVAERLCPDDWEQNRADAVDWLAEAFLRACNGDGSDLQHSAPWGYSKRPPEDPDYEPIEPPAEFEWAD
jgi:hypothetical protein